MWAEPEPGPSGREPIRKGYCGTCRVLYCNLEEHLSSLRHLDSVRCSRLSLSVSSRGKMTLMERFLQDVHKHHPHRYHDASPSHSDLPPVSMAAELPDDTSCPSADPERLLPREQGPGPPHTQTEPPANYANHATYANPDPHSPGGLGMPCGPIRAKHTEATPPYEQAPPPLHRKAHRKTNRRKHSDSDQTPPHRHTAPPDLRHTPQTPQPNTHTSTAPPAQSLGPRTTNPHSNTHSDTHSDTHSHSPGPIRKQHSPSSHSEDWDTPVQVTETKGRDYSGLVNATVTLTDQSYYSEQLHSALYQEVTSQPSAANQDPGFLSRPIESELPALPCFPESFRGKSWRQIERETDRIERETDRRERETDRRERETDRREREDEERVDRMIRQFRRGSFRCYFESEPLDRFGGRSQEPDALPLLAGDSDDSLPVRRRRRRSYRVTSRCQVVRVSHSTQTNNPVSLARPSVCPREATPPTGPAANHSAAESPAPWRQIPPSYSHIMTPLQRRTSLVYLLCSPGSSPLTTLSPAPLCPSPLTTLGPSPLGHAHRQSRRKRRPLQPQGSKVKYKPLPVCVYEPSSNRIIQPGPAPLGPSHLGHAPSCVRQLFRSLSHNTNAAGQSARSRVMRSQTKAMRGRSQTTRTQPSTPRKTNTHTKRNKHTLTQRQRHTERHTLTQRNTQRNTLTKRQRQTHTPRREGLRPRGPNRR